MKAEIKNISSLNFKVLLLIQLYGDTIFPNPNSDEIDDILRKYFIIHKKIS